MIADEMRVNTIYAWTEILERASGNHRGRRSGCQCRERLPDRPREAGGMPVLNDARKRAVEIECKQ